MKYAKAIVGSLAAGLTALGAAVVADGISAVEWVGIAGAVLVTFGAVFQTPNRDSSAV